MAYNSQKIIVHGACERARAHTAVRPYQILDVFPIP